VRSQVRALESRLKVLLVHLLKWQAQPQRRNSGWRRTTAEQRAGVEVTLARNPSLRPRLDALVQRAYARARLIAAFETNLDQALFPLSCPFTIGEITGAEFLPERAYDPSNGPASGRGN
jgi:hypothetical protein